MKTSRPDSFAILEQLRQMERNPFMTTRQNHGELASLFSTSTHITKKKHKESKSSSDFRFTLDFDEPTTSTWTLKDADIDKYVKSTTHSRNRPVEMSVSPSRRAEKKRSKELKEKPIFNRSKHEVELERSSSMAKSENKKTTQEVQHLVAETVNMVPVQYLIKHQMFEYVRKRALLSMKRVLDGMYIRLLRDGLYAWYNITTRIREAQIERAVAMLTRISRGFLARRKFKAMYQHRQEERQRQQRLQHYQAMTNGERATLLQSLIRAFLARKRFNSTVLLRRRAAIVIQRNYRNYHDRGKMYFLKKMLLQRIRAARLIQRVYRGFYGRMLCRIQRSRLRREKRQQRYETPEGLFEIFFEQHGAALRIQRWYWSLGWRVSVLKQRRLIVQERIRNIKCTIIQRHIRGYLARKSVMRLRYMRSITMGLSMHTIVLVQAIIRRFLVIRRMQKSRHTVETIRDFFQQNRLPKYKQRRPSIFYPHLRIGNERNILKLQRRAALIQRIYRIYAARKRFMAMVRNRKTLAAKRIQYWYHVCVYRKWLYASLRVIQPWWRRHAKNWFRINTAAKRV